MTNDVQRLFQSIGLPPDTAYTSFPTDTLEYRPRAGEKLLTEVFDQLAQPQSLVLKDIFARMSEASTCAGSDSAP